MIIGLDLRLQIYFICLYISLVVFSRSVIGMGVGSWESYCCTYLFFLAISVLIVVCLLYIYIFFTIILSFSSFQFDVIISKHPVTDVLRGEEPIDSGHSLAV